MHHKGQDPLFIHIIINLAVSLHIYVATHTPQVTDHHSFLAAQRINVGYNNEKSDHLISA